MYKIISAYFNEDKLVESLDEIREELVQEPEGIDLWSWNGEYHEMDGIRYYPVYVENDDNYDIIGYKIREY